MASVRQPAVAGTFYPADAAELENAVMANLDSPLAWDIPAKALVVPHAGHVYSGAIAGSAYASVRHLADQIERVVLLGPAHWVAFKGIAVPTADAHATPLGDITVDWQGVAEVLALPQVQLNDAAFEGEHSLEVHLPFLQRALGDFKLVPLLVGDAKPEGVEQVLRKLWGGPETLVVISTDLSHFHAYDAAQKLDLSASHAIETFNVEGLSGDLACGFRPLSGLLRAAQRLDLRPTTLDVRNSGDTAGDKSRVVGYGSYSFEYSGAARLPEKFREPLVDIAQQSIRHGIKNGNCPNVEVLGFPHPMRTLRRTFVSVHTGGQLRGCVGSLAANNPLIADVVQNAYRAAFEDKRFKPLSEDDLAETDISVSILSTPRAMSFRDEADLVAQIQPDTDGLILQDGQKRGIFLPVVWQQIATPQDFLRHLKNKAGLPLDHWSDGLKVWRYTTESFGAKFGPAPAGPAAN